MKQMAKLK